MLGRIRGRKAGGAEDLLQPQSKSLESGMWPARSYLPSMALAGLGGHCCSPVAGASWAQSVPACWPSPSPGVLWISLHIGGGMIGSSAQRLCPPVSQPSPCSMDAPSASHLLNLKILRGCRWMRISTRADCRRGTQSRAAESGDFITNSTSCSGFYQHLLRGHGCKCPVESGHHSSFHFFYKQVASSQDWKEKYV